MIIKKKHLNYDLFLALGISLSSILYLTKLGFSPVYPLTFCFGILALALRKNSYNNNEIILFIISLIFILITLLNNTLKFGQSSYLPPILVNLLLAPLVLLACFSTYKRMNKIELGFIARTFIWFVIFFATIDTVWKQFNPLVNPMYDISGSDIWFYKYKNSLMFGDSNGTAILLLTTLGLYLGLVKVELLKFKYFLILVMLVLIILTFSRAAIISSIFCLTIYIIPKRRLFLVLLSLVILTFFIYFLADILSVLKSDGSGNTKLNELRYIINFLSETPIYEWLFGVGYGLGENVTGRYIHGILPKLVIEGGMISFLVFSLFSIVTIYMYRNTVYIYLPLLLCSISLSLYIIVPFHVVSICLLIYAKKMTVNE